MSDNIRNMVAAFKKYQWVGCSAHQFNTVLKDTFKTLDSVPSKNLIDLIKVCEALVDHVKLTLSTIVRKCIVY